MSPSYSLLTHLLTHLLTTPLTLPLSPSSSLIVPTIPPPLTPIFSLTPLTLSPSYSLIVPTGSRVTADVTGLALVHEANDLSVSSVIVVTGLGRVTRIELNSLLGGSRFAASLAFNHSKNNNSNNNNSQGQSDEPLFHFHTGPLWALATEKKTPPTASGINNNSGVNNTNNGVNNMNSGVNNPNHFGGKGLSGKGAVFATGGDDRYLMVWCGRRRHMLARARAPAPLRCLGDDILIARLLAHLLPYFLPCLLPL